jgi:hypothetical protein
MLKRFLAVTTLALLLAVAAVASELYPQLLYALSFLDNFVRLGHARLIGAVQPGNRAEL